MYEVNVEVFDLPSEFSVKEICRSIGTAQNYMFCSRERVDCESLVLAYLEGSIVFGVVLGFKEIDENSDNLPTIIATLDPAFLKLAQGQYLDNAISINVSPIDKYANKDYVYSLCKNIGSLPGSRIEIDIRKECTESTFRTVAGRILCILAEKYNVSFDGKTIAVIVP